MFQPSTTNQSSTAQLLTTTDIYSLCVDSIVTQLRTKVENEAFNFADFESLLYTKLFNESLNHAVNNLDPAEDKKFLDSYKVTRSAEELINKLTLESATNPRFAQLLLNGIIQQYINLSLEYRVTAQSDIIAISIN
jgi:hypothetical protein